MRQHDWTDQLRDRLSDYGAAVPEGLWADIEQSLPQQHAVVTPLWRRWAAAAAIAAVAVGGGWWLWPTEESHNTPAQQHVARQKHAGSRQHPTQLVALANSHESLPIKQVQQPTGQRQTTQQPTGQLQPTQQQAAQPPQPTQQQHEHHYLPVSSTRPTTEPAPATSQSMHRRHTVSVGLHANSGLLAYNNSNGVQATPMALIASNNAAYTFTRTTSSNGQDIYWMNGYEERQHHDHPLSFGLTVGYPLTHRWSLLTGLVYTRLHSDFTNIMQQVQISKEQTLHYLGVPLGIQYHVLKSSHWTLYASVTAQLDWNVSAKYQTEGVRQEIRRDRPQWSAGANLGVEYSPIPLLGIYAEPGVRYYFDNGSRMQNYFKDRPTSWTLQVGLRLNLGKR